MSMHSDQSDKPSAPVRRSLGFGAIWRGVRHFPAVLALFVLVAVAAGVGVWFVLPRPQKTTTQILFQLSAQPRTLLHLAASDDSNFQSYCQQQAALVKSRQVLNAVVNQPNVANLATMQKQPDKIMWLDRNLQIDFQPSADFMRVSIEGDETDDMKAILDAVKTVYIKEVIAKESMQKLSRLRQLENVHGKYMTSLDAYRKRLGSLAEEIGVTDAATLSLRNKFAEERIGVAQRELLQLESDMRRAQIESSRLENKLKDPEQIETLKEAVEEATKKDPGYVRLAAAQTAIEQSIQKIKSMTQPGSNLPQLAAEEEKLAKSKKQLAESAERIRAEVINRLKESTAVESRRQLAGWRDRIAVWTNLKESIEADIANSTRSMRRSSLAQTDIEGIRRDMAHLEHTSDQVQQQIEDLRPELDAPSRVSVWEEPTVVPGSEGDYRIKYALMAIGGVLLFGIMVVTLVEVSLA